MSIFSRITTFLKTTLLSILTLFSRLCARPPPLHVSSVTPYPLAPHLENCIIDIGRDATANIDGKGIDLEKGVFSASYNSPVINQGTQNDAFSQSGATKTVFSEPEAAVAPKRNVSPIPVSRIVRHPAFGSVGKSASTAKQETTPPIPLSVVTNFAHIPGPPRKTIPTRTHGENSNSSRPETQTPRKTSPLRRMPRYLNLTGASPTKPPAIKRSLDHNTPHRGSNVGYAMKFDMARSKNRDASPLINPLKLESSLPAESVDWAARIRSVFYTNRMGDEDLSESIRDLFSRESASSIELDHSMNIIKDGDLLDDEDEYGRPLSVRSPCYSPSSEASSNAASFSGSTPASPLPCYSPSELPYLHGSHTGSGLSSSSSESFGAFNDLLASVERKYPGRYWKNIVQFTSDDGDDEYRGVNPYSGIAGEQKQWSDVFCLDEYAH